MKNSSLTNNFKNRKTTKILLPSSGNLKITDFIKNMITELSMFEYDPEHKTSKWGVILKKYAHSKEENQINAHL